MWEIISQWEIPLLHFIRDHATSWGDVFWTVLTVPGESGIFWILLSLALMIPKKTRQAGFAMGLALLIGLILGNGVMKNLFARPRPYTFDGDLVHRLVMLEMSTDFSFPSGHSLASFEAATALFLHHKKWGIAALVVASLTAISRIFLLVHFPSDVVFGILFGILFAIAAKKLIQMLWEKCPAIGSFSFAKKSE